MHETLVILVRAFEQMAESHRLLAAHLERSLEEHQASRAALESRLRELERDRHALTQSNLALGRQAATLDAEMGGVRVENAHLRDVDRRRVDSLTALAHELRTPLSALAASLDLLGSDFGGPEERKELLTIARLNTERLARLMGRLRDAEWLEAAAFARGRAPIDLGVAVAQAVESVRGLARERGISVKVSGPPAMDPVPGDEEQVQSVVINLLENALKYSRAGDAVSVEISDRGQDALVMVTDEGPGIAPGDLPHIFEQFYRGGAQGQGSGLGLYICRLIVEDHGGRIWVEPQPRGTRFCFTLPREAPSGAAPPSPA